MQQRWWRAVADFLALSTSPTIRQGVAPQWDETMRRCRWWWRVVAWLQNNLGEFFLFSSPRWWRVIVWLPLLLWFRFRHIFSANNRRRCRAWQSSYLCVSGFAEVIDDNGWQRSRWKMRGLRDWGLWQWPRSSSHVDLEHCCRSRHKVVHYLLDHLYQVFTQIVGIETTKWPVPSLGNCWLVTDIPLDVMVPLARCSSLSSCFRISFVYSFMSRVESC